MTNELLPCPFCGQAPKLYPKRGVVGCVNGACGADAAAKIEVWNTRPIATPSDDKELVEKLTRKVLYRPNEWQLANPNGPEAATRISTLREALDTTHRLISDFAISGFTDPQIGERLFLNQGRVFAALSPDGCRDG